jgi:hypothetical protein
VQLQLWGTTEQMKLLKLLIALEEFEMAAEGFAVMKVRLVASRLCLWALCKMCVWMCVFIV